MVHIDAVEQFVDVNPVHQFIDVDTAQQLVDVNTLHEFIDVDSVEQLVDVDTLHEGVDIDLFDDLLRVDDVDDRSCRLRGETGQETIALLRIAIGRGRGGDQQDEQRKMTIAHAATISRADAADRRGALWEEHRGSLGRRRFEPWM